jgi:hypothetical protein
MTELDDLITGRGGNRIPWESMPSPVRSAIEDHFGSEVVRATTQPGGFSPGVAARLALKNGRNVFVKAVGANPNPHSPEMHRREATVAANLPEVAATPRLLWTYDDGDWVALVFEDVEGDPPRLPWKADELSRVLDAVTQLALALTPSPIDAPMIEERLAEPFTGWRTLAQETELRERLEANIARHVDRLVDIEAEWPKASRGETLVHCDIRADNILIAADRVVVVDWPHASIGAAWLDFAFMLPSIGMQGGPRPWGIFDGHELSSAADSHDVNAVLSALSGYFMHGSVLPPPPGIPSLRQFQRFQGDETIEWLRQRGVI